MKQAKTAIFLILLICLSRGNQFQGWDTIATQSDPTNSSSCMLTLSDTVNSTAMTLTQWGSMGALQGAALGQCNYANFVFQSFFESDSLTDVVAFPTNVDNNKVDAFIDANVLISHNGTGCVKLPQTAIASDSYVCKFKWNTVSLYTAIYGTGNFTFDTNQYTLLIPSYDVIRSSTSQYNNFIANSSFPSTMGLLSDACGSNNNIPTLETTVVVSSNANLTQLLPGMSLAYTLVKRNGAPLGDYHVIPAKANSNLFDNYWSNINCWSLQMSYKDILPDMDLCKNGCQFSFIFTNSRQAFYLLETMGVATSNTTITGTGTNTIGTGNQNTNTNGNGNGNNNSSSNTTGNTNGTNTNNNTNTNGNNVVSNSAASLGIQMVIVALIALICLNL